MQKAKIRLGMQTSQKVVVPIESDSDSEESIDSDAEPEETPEQILEKQSKSSAEHLDQVSQLFVSTVKGPKFAAPLFLHLCILFY